METPGEVGVGGLLLHYLQGRSPVLSGAPCGGFSEARCSHYPSQLWPLPWTAMPLLVPDTPGHRMTPHCPGQGVLWGTCTPGISLLETLLASRRLHLPGFPLLAWPLVLCAPHQWNVCHLLLKCPGECGQRHSDLRFHPRPLEKSCVTLSKQVTLSEPRFSSVQLGL